MSKYSKFTPGRGCFRCECCGRQTRETFSGTGDYCQPCEELMMLQNSHWDGSYDPGVDDWGDKLRDDWIAKIAKGGGNVATVKRICAAIFPNEGGR
jgi:hypothetical protein